MGDTAYSEVDEQMDDKGHDNRQCRDLRKRYKETNSNSLVPKVATGTIRLLFNQLQDTSDPLVRRYGSLKPFSKTYRVCPQSPCHHRPTHPLDCLLYTSDAADE